ncbi:uncharacterized protein AAG666_010406 [Megaptera novaeangliae]
MLFTETAHFVVNFLLSRRPRAMPPHRLDQELCFWGCRGPAMPAPASHRSLGGYWLSPQRRRPPGAAWRWPARNLLLLLPGAAGCHRAGGRTLGASAQLLRRAPAPHVEVPVAEY